MPTYRARDPDDPLGKTQGIVKHTLLEKPFTRTFDSRAEAEEYCGQLQQALDAGIVPAGVARLLTTGAHVSGPQTLLVAAREYEQAVALKPHDSDTLSSLLRTEYAGTRLSQTRTRAVTREWVEGFVKDLKLAGHLAPGTIKKRVGCLRRLFQWLVNNRPGTVAVNPFSALPRNYGAYTEPEKRALRHAGVEALPEDRERDRRLTTEEEEAVRLVLSGHVRPDRERAPDLKDRAELLLLFTLAVETAMRLREMYTLTSDQIDLVKRTIFLDKTKNGDSRQVPLSTVACAALAAYSDSIAVKLGAVGKKGVRRRGGQLLFPILFDGSDDVKMLNKATSRISRRFGWLFAYAGIEGLRFHDLRHEATARFYERTDLTDVQIARITGHKDLRMLRRYASLRGSDLAPRLW